MDSLALSVKNRPASAGDVDLIPGSGRSSGEGNGNPLPIFLPEKSHGQRTVGLQSMGVTKKSDMT